MTLCRRYHELATNLPANLEAFERELGYRPRVVLVWARPEPGRLWLIRDLVARGLVGVVLGRPACPGERDDGPTTLPESLNIRMGLEYVREHHPDCYVVMTAADIRLQEGTAGFFDHHVNREGCEAVVFHLDNGLCRDGIWHTNCFAVGTDERYWPPVSPPDSDDILERQWGRLLAERALPAVHSWHNYASRKFLHRHESESLPPAAAVGLHAGRAAPCLLAGRRGWLGYLLDVLGLGPGARCRRN